MHWSGSVVSGRLSAGAQGGISLQPLASFVTSDSSLHSSHLRVLVYKMVVEIADHLTVLIWKLNFLCNTLGLCRWQVLGRCLLLLFNDPWGPSVNSLLLSKACRAVLAVKEPGELRSTSASESSGVLQFSPSILPTERAYRVQMRLCHHQSLLCSGIEFPALFWLSLSLVIMLTHRNQPTAFLSSYLLVRVPYHGICWLCSPLVCFSSALRALWSQRPLWSAFGDGPTWVKLSPACVEDLLGNPSHMSKAPLPGLASRACYQHRARHSERPVLGLMLYCCYLEMFNFYVWTLFWKQNPHMSRGNKHCVSSSMLPCGQCLCCPMNKEFRWLHDT